MKCKFLVVGILTAFFATAKADLSTIELDYTQFTGAVTVFPMPNPTDVTSGEGGSAMNMFPVTYALFPRPNSMYPGYFATSVQVKQLRAYNYVTNRFTDITPVVKAAGLPAISKSAGSDIGSGPQVCNDLDSRIFSAISSEPNVHRQFGKFELSISIQTTSGGPFTTIFQHTFIVSPLGMRDAAAELDDMPNPGITPGDLNDQNVNQGGFWEGIFQSLFIPDPENVNTMKDVLMNVMNWGPFGIINFFVSDVETQRHLYGNEDLERGYAFSVNLPYSGATQFDLNPYETFIKVGRFIMAMGLWALFIWKFWAYIKGRIST